MSSVFRLDDNARPHPKRNTFDLSFQNNLTLKFGRLVPVFCKEVLPGDSFKIEPTFALRYLPQVFPVQTRQRCSVKYYYVRNRNLWKDWQDFIGKTKTGLTPPYLHFNNNDKNLITHSTIADYMGIPVKVTAPVDAIVQIGSPSYISGFDYAYVPNGSLVYGDMFEEQGVVRTFKNIQASLSPTTLNLNLPLDYVYGGTAAGGVLPLPKYKTENSLAVAIRPVSLQGETDVLYNLYRVPMVVKSGTITNLLPNVQYMFVIVRTISGVDVIVPIESYDYNTYVYSDTITYNKWNGTTMDSITEEVASIVGTLSVPKDGHYRHEMIAASSIFNAEVNRNEDLTWSDLEYGTSTENYKYFPFSSVNNVDGIRISALPFRAIQSIYNALIRNAENNPLIIDGQPEYNRYILSDEGGATSPADLLCDYFVNWSDDRFTTALPSPQQGNAPLVGLTGTTGATFVIGNEDGSQSTIRLTVNDGGSVVGVVEGESSAPADLVSEMWNAVDYGISINDLRNVNAYQRWKENNIRVGYKYKDQISAHYGVSVRFDVLDMPEFLGGVSRDVSVQQVTQTVTNEDGNLGDIAGQSGIFGDGHSIEHFCDEHGFIIGLMEVHPMPIYQDTLPKYLIKSDPFDYYFPEFGKIGPQPITNKELSFSTSLFDGSSEQLFGYQRAWYDYLESLDEVHGLYRTDFRNFILARDFSSTPELGSEFLTIHDEQLNNTFYSLDDKDKILGQIYHKITAKRAIPLYGIPSIE